MVNMVIIFSTMARTTSPALPAVERLLGELGENVRLARLRRRLSAALLAERAGMSRPTLRAIERGDPGVTLGSLTNVLHCLGLEGGLGDLARDDELGRTLQDARLPTRRRKRSQGKGADGE